MSKFGPYRTEFFDGISQSLFVSTKQFFYNHEKRNWTGNGEVLLKYKANILFLSNLQY